MNKLGTAYKTKTIIYRILSLFSAVFFISTFSKTNSVITLVLFPIALLFTFWIGIEIFVTNPQSKIWKLKKIIEHKKPIESQ